jgi:hypothetical protein
MNAQEALDRADELLHHTWGMLGNDNWSDPRQVGGIVETMRRNLEEAQAALNKAREAMGLATTHDWPFNKTVEVMAAKCRSCEGNEEVTCPACGGEGKMVCCDSKVGDCAECDGSGMVVCPECV